MTETSEHVEPEILLEINESLRLARDRSGAALERELATQKLEQIAHPETEFPKKDTSYGGVNGRLVLFDGLLEDYGQELNSQPGLVQNVNKMRDATLEHVKKDYETTVEGYNNLTLPEDPTVVASNQEEKDLIEEAAKLLKYDIREGYEGKRFFTPRPGRRITGSIENAVNTRVSIGIQNLIEDYTNEHGIRRPVLRTVVAMADQAAKAARGWSGGL